MSKSKDTVNETSKRDCSNTVIPKGKGAMSTAGLQDKRKRDDQKIKKIP